MYSKKIGSHNNVALFILRKKVQIINLEFITQLQKEVTLEVIYIIFYILVAFDISIGSFKVWKKGGFKSRTLRDGMFGSMVELIFLLICIIIAKLIPIFSFIVYLILIVIILK